MTTLILALILFQDVSRRWLDRVIDRLPKRIGAPVGATVQSFVDGLDALTDLRQLLTLLLASAYVWAPFALVALAMGMDIGYGVPVLRLAIVATALVAVFFMIPAVPGFVGTFQVGCIVALGIFGVPKSEALGYALLVHALTLVPPTLLGFGFLVAEGVQLRGVSSAQARATSVDSPFADTVEEGFEPPDVIQNSGAKALLGESR